jgi:septum formation protein
MDAPAFILASRSPRRAEILALLGIAFRAVPAEVDETPLGGETPAQYAARMAMEKARTVSEAHPEALVLGADTVVHAGGKIYGTPAMLDEARAVLRDLSGGDHLVTTALALVRRNPPHESHAEETTKVSFRKLDDTLIERYVATKEPYDKAAGYGIQEKGGLALVSQVHGSYTNVVGLPVDALTRLLKEAK